MIKVSIIIANNLVNWSFPKQVLRRGLEVIVVNNGITGPGNACKARNKGARQAIGEYLLFLDNDTLVKKGWLDRVVKFMDKHPEVGAGQLKLLKIDNNQFDSAGEKITGNGFLAERAQGAKDRGQFDQPEPIFSGKGAAMLVRRKIFEKIQGFDEDYGYYWEEPDLFWRVWKSGNRVVFLWMGMVRHVYNSQQKPLPKEVAANTVYLGCRNHYLTIIKNAVGWRLPWMLLWVGLAWLNLEIMFLIKGKWQQALAIERATFWIIFRLGSVIKKRQWVQKNLKSSDGWMKQVLASRGWNWYVGKGLAYISGREF